MHRTALNCLQPAPSTLLAVRSYPFPSQVSAARACEFQSLVEELGDEIRRLRRQARHMERGCQQGCEGAGRNRLRAYQQAACFGFK